MADRGDRDYEKEEARNSKRVLETQIEREFSFTLGGLFKKVRNIGSTFVHNPVKTTKKMASKNISLVVKEGDIPDAVGNFVYDHFGGGKEFLRIPLAVVGRYAISNIEKHGRVISVEEKLRVRRVGVMSDDEIQASMEYRTVFPEEEDII